MWYVYILKCNDNSYYVGSSTNIEDRVKRHNQGKGAQYTKLRRPVTLVYVERFDIKNLAERREIQIKKMSVINKEHLIKYGTGERFPSGNRI